MRHLWFVWHIALKRPTGSGKTYSLSGTQQSTRFHQRHTSIVKRRNQNSNSCESAGLAQRCISYIFKLIRRKERSSPCTTYKLQASYVELYQERLADLLSPDSTLTIRQSSTNDLGPTFHVEGSCIVTCASEDDLFAVLEEGSMQRQVRAHNLNEYSSRSHTILTIFVSSYHKKEDGSTEERKGKLSLCDLAGRSVSIFSLKKAFHWFVSLFYTDFVHSELCL